MKGGKEVETGLLAEEYLEKYNLITNSSNSLRQIVLYIYKIFKFLFLMFCSFHYNFNISFHIEII